MLHSLLPAFFSEFPLCAAKLEGLELSHISLAVTSPPPKFLNKSLVH